MEAWEEESGGGKGRKGEGEKSNKACLETVGDAVLSGTYGVIKPMADNM